MNNLNKIAIKIIKEQELIIGPLAWIEARKVSGLNIINEKNGEVNINDNDGMQIIDSLVGQYERLFGRASHEVCKDAVTNLIKGLPTSEIPLSLR